MSKEHPILFNAPMVRAVLNGSKTQTRRIVKPQPDDVPIGVEWTHPKKLGGYTCPFGQIGDQLWVRESWRELEYPTMESKFDFRECAIWRGDAEQHKWKPSIHMPRLASRITLEIVNVRVERLQDISEADAQAEGALNINGEYAEGFAVLWESINGPGSWDANQWVWVIEFKMVKP